MVRLLSLTLLLASTTALARPNLPAAEWDRLAKHEVVGYSDPWQNGVEKAKAIGVIDFAPEEVFRIVTDYDRWKDYLPRVRDSRVLSQSGPTAMVDLLAELPWPAGAARVAARYLHERLPGDIYRIRFEMVSGTMKQYSGSLYIEPFVPGKSTVTYELVAEPDVIAPDSTINKSVLKSARGFVHALRWHINQLFEAGRLRSTPYAISPPGISSASR
jgi:ribosome-associated toxin RatA of RatAB toxin-antitoxin module